MILPLLYMVVFCDMFAYAMFVSTVSFLFLEGPYSILPMSCQSRHLYLGFYLSSYSFIQIFSTPFWGNKTLQWGKKKVLVCSMFGNFLGYLCCVCGIFFKEVWWVLGGTCLAGLFGANISTVYAYISCESKNSDWARYFSLLGSMMGLSFLMGPQVTASMIHSYKDLHICLFTSSLCVGVTFINLIILSFFLRPDESPRENEKRNTISSLFLFRLSWKSGLFPILLFLSCIHFGWVFFIKFYQVYLLETVGLNHGDCCQVTSYLGMSCALWQGLRYWGDHFIPKSCWWLLSMVTLMGLALFSFSVLISLQGTIFCTVLLSFAYSMIIPTGLSLFLSHDDGGVKEQKTAAYQSLCSLTKVLAPLLSGLSSHFLFYRTNIVSALVVLAAGIIIIIRPGLFLLREKRL